MTWGDEEWYEEHDGWDWEITLARFKPLQGHISNIFHIVHYFNNDVTKTIFKDSRLYVAPVSFDLK